MARLAGVVIRCAFAAVLLVAALLSPLLGIGGCEYYEGRVFLGVVQSDWLMGAALLGGGACAAGAVQLVRAAFGR